MEVTVPRSRVVEEGNFVQYELRTRCVGKPDSEAVAWRRFNEFKKLHAALRASDDSGLAAELPELPSSTSFFARYGITATDIDERRTHLQSYIQDVVGRVGEHSALLRDFLALAAPCAARGGPAEREQHESVTTPQRSENINVPQAAERSTSQASPGSPYAISPPDSYHGDTQADVFDLASWVLLEDSDDEDEAAGAAIRSAGGELKYAKTREPARDCCGSTEGVSEQAAAPSSDAASEAASAPAAGAGGKPRRSYVAAARASLLVGEALPPEPTKLQMVSWLQRNTSPGFLRENHLTGHPRAIANARSREELADAYYLALVAKVPVDKLEGLIFDTMDSDLDERVNRNELRYSPFEQSLGPAWDEIANGKHHIERSDWSRYVEAAKAKVGVAVEKFLADLVFEADVDVAHLLPQVHASQTVGA